MNLSFLRSLDRRVLLDRFDKFVPRFWPVVTGGPYVPNRVTKAIIAAYQDVADGKVRRLIISKPPGCGASTLNVLFRGFRFARDPSWRTMEASHSYELAATASRRVRRLVTSPEFCAMFPVQLRDDAAQISLWETSAGGHFIAVGRDSNVTGRRVNEILCDDLNAAADRYSKAALDHAWTFFNDTLTTRIDNDRSAMIVCAQRTAVDDVPGRLIDLAAAGWTVVSIPAEDENGEPMAPNVLPRERLDEIRAQIGAIAYSTQYLQEALPSTGGMFRRDWFTIVDSAPEGGHVVRGWDLAASTEKRSDWTAGVRLRLVNGKIYVEDCRAIQGTPHAVEALIAECAATDGAATEISIPQDPGQAGKSQKSYLAAKLHGYDVRFSPETGSKELRAQPFASQAEAGNIYIVRGHWNTAYLDDLAAFPAAGRDRTDATSRAYALLATKGAHEAAPCGGRIFIRGSDSAPPGMPVHDERRSVFDQYRSHALRGGFVPGD